MAYRVFIGSSRESLEYAEEIQRNLEMARIPELEPVCWPAIFRLGSYTLESLLRALKTSTFGVFVLAPDDYIEIRDESYRIPRDNVILEMGMFIAGVGRKNTFLVTPYDTDDFILRLPTDLGGVTLTYYASHLYDGDIALQVTSACSQIKATIRGELRKKMADVEEDKEQKPDLDDKRKKILDRIKEYQKHV